MDWFCGGLPMTRVKRIVEGFCSDPEFEAMKATRRSISHREAVRESVFLTDQWRSMWGKKPE
jgi:hypothetical protein